MPKISLRQVKLDLLSQNISRVLQQSPFFLFFYIEVSGLQIGSNAPHNYMPFSAVLKCRYFGKYCFTSVFYHLRSYFRGVLCYRKYIIGVAQKNKTKTKLNIYRYISSCLPKRVTAFTRLSQTNYIKKMVRTCYEKYILYYGLEQLDILQYIPIKRSPQFIDLLFGIICGKKSNCKYIFATSRTIAQHRHN